MTGAWFFNCYTVLPAWYWSEIGSLSPQQSAPWAAMPALSAPATEPLSFTIETCTLKFDANRNWTPVKHVHSGETSVQTSKNIERTQSSAAAGASLSALPAALGSSQRRLVTAGGWFHHGTPRLLLGHVQSRFQYGRMTLDILPSAYD